MVTAIVLIEAESHKIHDVAERLVEIEGIPEVFSVAGRHDLVALLRVAKNEDIADIVSSKLRQLDGVVRTETLIAFRVYSRDDIEGMFSVGKG